jgi:hypothetical protein
MSEQTNDRSANVEAVRRRSEQAATRQPEPRFGARRTRKPRRPVDVPAVQREFRFDGEVQE